ncbi:MAG: hypothetical protein WCF90_08050 [Methanomicrobiales archaeon]
MRYFDWNTILRTLRYTDTYRTSSHASTLFSCDIARNPAPVLDIEPSTAEPPVDTRSRVRVVLPALWATPSVTDKKLSLKAAARDPLEHEHYDEHQHPKPGTYDEHKVEQIPLTSKKKLEKAPQNCPATQRYENAFQNKPGFVISGILRLHEMIPPGFAGAR